MRNLIKSLTINRIYTFFGSREDLDACIKQSDIKHNIVSDGLVEFAASISWGTGTYMPPIGVKVSVVKVDLDEIKVMMRTTKRPEQYFMVVIGAIVFVASVFEVDDMPASIYVLLVWIFFHTWFHLVFRVQENILAKKVAKALRLRTRQL
jgi:hypothetical protein